MAPRLSASRDIRIIVGLECNRVSHGDAPVRLRGETVLIRREDLERLKLLLPSVAGENIDGVEYVDLAELKPLTFALDDTDVVLRLEAPPEFFPLTVQNLRPAPTEMEHRLDESAYFNYAPRFSFGPRPGGSDVRRLDVYSEAAYIRDGRSVFSSAYLSSENSPVRGLSNLVVDDRNSLRRFTFGDNFAATGALGGATFFAGVTVASAFQLDPYFIPLPPLGYSGSVATPSTLDVFVNGQRVRRTQLDPGPFRLENAPFVPGGGVTTYVIRDVFGREQQVGIPFYVSPGALAPGLAEYTYTAGVQRFGVGVESWDYRSGLILARHRVGLSKNFTAGMRWEAANELLSGGPSLTAVFPFGQFDLEAAASTDHQAGGAAGLFGYSFISRGFAGGVSARMTTPRYATVSLAAADDRALVDGTVFTSVPITRRSSFTMQYALGARRDSGLSGRISGVYNVQLSRMFNLVASAARYHRPDGESPFEVFATVSVFFGGGHTASVGAGRRGETEQLSINANKPLPVGEGYGYRASANFGEQRQLTAGAQYQTLFGRYGVTYNSVGDTHDVFLDAAGSLVWIRDGGVHASLPVRESFGLIVVPGVANVRGYLNNQEIGRTDKHGRLLVPTMISYYGNRLSIADRDVPLSYTLGATERIVAPPFRGAGVARFESKKSRYLRGGIVVVKADSRTVPKYGEITLRALPSAVSSPIGPAGQFEFVDVSAGAYPAHIEYKEGACEFLLTIPDDDRAIVELGEVACVAR